MTKRWPQQSLLPQPEHRSHQLDFHINEQQSFLLSNVARISAAQRQPQFPVLMSLQQLPRLENPSERPEHICNATEFTERAASPGLSYPNAQNDHLKQKIINQDTLEKSKATGGKKKNYKRYPKPPYSYLAMIAMVIQRSTEKKLTLSEILKEISTLFPFFEGNYKGWRDSVRHNLSSYNCFVKVLKDPSKPQGKGNFWAVDQVTIPLELLKRQNTAVSRQDETIFAQDLAPYILQGQKPESERPRDPVNSLPLVRSVNPSPPREDLFQPKLDSSFTIDSLLHRLRPTSASGEAGVTTRDCYGEVERIRPSPGPQPRYASSARSASGTPSLASMSPYSSDEEFKGMARSKKHSHPDDEASLNSYENYGQPQQESARHGVSWELPTSYAKNVPPNTIAPPSMRFSGGPLMSLCSEIPLYGYSSSPVVPGHFLGHACWPILPSMGVSVQSPLPPMDLDNMLQTVPPNKSVYDALVPAGWASNSHFQPLNQYTLQNMVPLNRYHQY